MNSLQQTKNALRKIFFATHFICKKQSREQKLFERSEFFCS